MGTNGISNDGLNKEQASKKSVYIESDDLSGKVLRERVADQTVFDKMFLSGLIEIRHHEAAHKFIDDLYRSGSSIQAIDISKIGSPKGKPGVSAAERAMIFSSAYRSISDMPDEDTVKIFMRMANSPYDPSAIKMSDQDLDSLANSFVPVLTRLADHYKIAHKKDPRSVVFNQMYRTVPRKRI
jgi:hypothetical protein